MKVVCINDDWEPRRGNPAPAFMQECIVFATATALGSVYYKLNGFPSHLGYAADHFAILPDEPAEVINEQEREAILI